MEIWKRARLIGPKTPLISSGNQHLLPPLFEDLLQLTEPKSRRRSFETAALRHLLVARALSGSKGEGVATTSYDERLHEAGDYLRMHPELDIDLPQLARYLGMSYRTFRRSFTQHFGNSPDRFHQEARVGEAVPHRNRFAAEEYCRAIAFFQRVLPDASLQPIETSHLAIEMPRRGDIGWEPRCRGRRRSRIIDILL